MNPELIRKYPGAFERGRKARLAHYAKVDAGAIKEHPLPDNPYRLNCGRWRAWNAGWYEGGPSESESEEGQGA